MNNLNPDFSQILAENARRNARLVVPYDPERGIGCVGDRVQVGDLHLPQQLLDACPHFTRLSPLEQERLRIRFDFEYWCVRAVIIRDKITGRDIPFVLNAPQRRILAMLEKQRTARLPIRLVMLKARQWGGSTLVQIYMAWLQIVHHRSWNSLICGHKQNTARVIKGMYGRLVSHYPQRLLDAGAARLRFRSFEGSPTVQHLDGRDSLIIMATALSEDAVRGHDIAMAHLSEVAFWKTSAMHAPTDVIRAVGGTVSMAPDTMVILESTANGTGNFFHREWLRASAGRSDKAAVFIPWYEIEMYRTPVTDVKALWQELDDYEIALWDRGLTLEMINWYHIKRREYAGHEQMMAEFPTTDIEAFVCSGAGVFVPSQLDALRVGCRAPAAIGEIQLIRHRVTFVPHSGGGLQIWEAPRKGHCYVAAVDVGGRSASSDYSVILIIDAHAGNPDHGPEVVAQWRGHIDHDLLADKAQLLGRYYYNALLIIESNTLDKGEAAVELVLERAAHNYRNFFRRRNHKPGFHTNRRTKKAAIGTLVAAVRDGSYIERSHAAIDEMAEYEYKEDGSVGAADGAHDDMVMARAIALCVIAANRLNTHLALDKDVKELFIGNFGYELFVHNFETETAAAAENETGDEHANLNATENDSATGQEPEFERELEDTPGDIKVLTES